MNYQDIVNNIKKKKSFLCVGLDSDLNKLPEHLKNSENAVFEFNKLIIDATKDYTVAYKPNWAFYESSGIKGLQNLEMTVNYLKENYPDIFIIADAKRGDIGNTSAMYAKAVFEEQKFDAVTVAPYMGEDSVGPFIEYKDKWVILLALTSNKGAFDFQYMKDVETGKCLYEQVLETSQKWADKNQMMYVVGATKADQLENVRKFVPEHFLLVPGVGAQGGSLEEVAKYGMNKNCGLLVNSSRGIIFADKSESFAKVAGEKAREMQQQMSELMDKYM